MKSKFIQQLTRRKVWIRTVLQIFFFGLVALLAVNHVLAEEGMAIPWLEESSLHGLCPFGGVVSLYQYITEGTFVQKIHESSFILMMIAVGMSVIFGPVFCGWMCPLGSIQEWFGKLGKKLFGKKRYNNFIPAKVDRWLRYLRYGMLAWVLYMTIQSGYLIFADIDPYHALFNFWSSEAAIGGMIVLAVTLVASLFVERPWCKYACPFGALLGLTNLFSIFRIKRQASTCTLCRSCDTACPMNIKVSEQHVVRDHQCIRCLECTSEASCPIAATVDFVAGGK